jgi:acyl-homoserine lactone acylase PvdQ
LPSSTTILGVYRKVTSAATKKVANKVVNSPASSLFSLYDGREITAWAEDLGHVEGKGSNNWVVAGNYSASGKPTLANDPHLGLNAPAIWYFALLQAPAADAEPALDVIGATLPGLPGVVLGRTAGVARGFTNTGPDVQDLYLERINPANPLQYQTAEGWAEFASRAETIKVKGQGDEVLTLRRTRHGPVLSDEQKSHTELLEVWAADGFRFKPPRNRYRLSILPAPIATAIGSSVSPNATRFSTVCPRNLLPPRLLEVWAADGFRFKPPKPSAAQTPSSPP